MKVSAFITNMDSPLGNYVGNSLEVAESIQSLQNKGAKDLLELTSILGRYTYIFYNFMLIVFTQVVFHISIYLLSLVISNLT